jgi:glycosyltransferase involved in cell wall biosynthesis
MGKEDVTIILPCLNEEKTLLKCVKQIKTVLNKNKCNYKILVCDNGSTDKSIEICQKNNIEYLVENKKGYGNALLAGIKAAKTKYIVMLDCDLSYDVKSIPRFITELKNGYDVIIGNRFKGKIEDGAMSLSHRIGSRFLTRYANLLFHTPINDFHCGLRAFDRKKLLDTGIKSPGFEFASEMIIRAKTNKLRLKEIETNLFKDGRGRKPHLRTIRDGFRHLHEINSLRISL